MLKKIITLLRHPFPEKPQIQPARVRCYQPSLPFEQQEVRTSHSTLYKTTNLR